MASAESAYIVGTELVADGVMNRLMILMTNIVRLSQRLQGGIAWLRNSLQSG